MPTNKLKDILAVVIGYLIPFAVYLYLGPILFKGVKDDPFFIGPIFLMFYGVPILFIVGTIVTAPFAWAYERLREK